MTRQTLEKRIGQHFRSAKKTPFRDALRKYGTSGFEFSIIDSAADWTELQEKERHWIKELDSKHPSGYNLTDGGDGQQGLTDETREKLSRANRNRVVSEETRRKMSKAQRARVWTGEQRLEWSKRATLRFSGIKLSDERKLHISECQRGKKRGPHSEETRRKISEAHKGMAPSEEARQKISATLMGNRPWNKGKRLSEQHCSHLSLSHIGKKHSEETRLKMSVAHRTRI